MVMMMKVMLMVTMMARYDVIAKMESFSEDTQFTLAQVCSPLYTTLHCIRLHYTALHPRLAWRPS